MIRRLATGFTALMAVLAVSLSWAPSAQAYDPQTKPQPWAYEKGLIPPESLTLRAGLNGHWPLWERAGAPRDISQNNNHGTLPGGTQDPAWIATDRGPALTGDGSDDFIEVGHTDAIGDHVFTITYWARTSAAIADPAVFYEGQAGDSSVHMILYFADSGNGNAVRFRIQPSGGNTSQIIGGGDVADGEWHHVVCLSRATNDRELYVDGVSVGTNTSSRNTFTTDTTHIVGDNVHGQFGNADILDTRVYDRALTDSEIKLLFTQGFADVWPEYSQQPTDGAAEEVTAAAPQIIIISWITGLASLSLLAYMRRRNENERDGFHR